LGRKINLVKIRIMKKNKSLKILEMIDCVIDDSSERIFGPRRRRIKRKKIARISAILIAVVVAIISYSFLVKASKFDFYPTSCLGTWENPENAEGKPSLKPNALNEEFNSSNSAFFSGGSKQIFCGRFDTRGDKTNKDFKKAILKFSWTIVPAASSSKDFLPSPNPTPLILEQSEFESEVLDLDPDDKIIVIPDQPVISSSSLETTPTLEPEIIPTSSPESTLEVTPAGSSDEPSLGQDSQAPTPEPTLASTPTPTLEVTPESTPETNPTESPVASTSFFRISNFVLTTIFGVDSEATSSESILEIASNSLPELTPIPSSEPTLDLTPIPTPETISTPELIPEAILEPTFQPLLEALLSEQLASKSEQLPTLSPTLPIPSDEETSSDTESSILDLSAPDSSGGQIGTSPSEEQSLGSSISDQNQSDSEEIGTTPIPQLLDDFFEVLYSLNGESWQLLANVSEKNFDNLSIDLPIDSWESVDSLQIMINVLPFPGQLPQIFLDSMWLEAEYKKIDRLGNEIASSSFVINSIHKKYDNMEPSVAQGIQDKYLYTNASVIHWMGDIDGDGSDDFSISEEDQEGNKELNIYSGSSGKKIYTHQLNSRHLGIATGLGDINNDGISDYVILDPSFSTGEGGAIENERGKLTAYSGADNSALWVYTGTSDFQFQSGNTKMLLLSGNDYNGDGISDLAVGTPGMNVNDIRAGAILIIDSVTGRVIRRYDGRGVDSRIGSSFDIGPDLNDDGFKEIVIGDPLAKINDNVSMGRIKLVSGIDFSERFSLPGYLGQGSAHLMSRLVSPLE